MKKHSSLTMEDISKEKLLKSIEISLFAEFPAPIIYGGLEIQCMRTFNALKKTGINVSLLDYYSPEQKVDILHIFGNPPGMYEICNHASKTKKVIISAVFGGAIISRFQTWAIRTLASFLTLVNQRIDYTRINQMLGLASRIISLNEKEKDFIIERYSIPSGKITVIPNGVDEQFFNTPGDVFIKKYGVNDFVLYTGNIIQRKNPFRLAKVLKKLGLKGVFIGQPFPTERAYATEFEKIINSSPGLLWIKGLRHEDKLLASAYKTSALFCLPSLAEGQSLSSLEAMAAGKPIILGNRPYSYQPGYEHVLRCNPQDEGSIEETIKEALGNSQKYSHQLPKSYSWDNVARKIIKAYQEVLK